MTSDWGRRRLWLDLTFSIKQFLIKEHRLYKGLRKKRAFSFYPIWEHFMPAVRSRIGT